MLLVFHDQKQTKIAGDGLMTPYLAAWHSIGFLEEMCGVHFHWNGEIPNMKAEQKSKIWFSLPVINILTCLKICWLCDTCVAFICRIITNIPVNTKSG